MRALIVTLLAAPLLGCIWVVEDRRPDPAPQYMAVDDDEVRFVIYREYYGCSHAEIAVMRHYRYYYGYDDCDLWFLLFFCRHMRLDFHIVVRRYEACGRRMHILVRDSGCDPDIFFVRVIDVDRCPPPYGRAYGYWKKRHLHTAELSNDEFRALIDLRIAVDYYGHSPETFFARLRTSEMPCRVLYREYRDAGKGGRNCTNQAVVKGERPWELPRDRREAWKRELKQREDREHEKFKEEHAEKVREHRAKEDKNWRDDDERGRPSKPKSEEPPSRGPSQPKSEDERGPSRPPSKEPPGRSEDDERAPAKREEPRGPSKPPSNEPPAKSEEPRKAPSKEPAPPAKSEEERGRGKSEPKEPPAPKNEPKGKSKEPPPDPEPEKKPQDEEKGKKKK